VRTPLLDDVRPSVRDVVTRAGERLAADGAQLEDVNLPRLADAALSVAGVLTELQAALLPLAIEHPEGLAHPEIRYRILAAEFFAAGDARRARQLAARIRAEVAAAFDRTDVLLPPTNTTTAFPIDATEVVVGEGVAVDLRRPGGQARITTRLTLPFNVAGVPAISVPAASLVDGLPVGIQLVAPPVAGVAPAARGRPAHGSPRGRPARLPAAIGGRRRLTGPSAVFGL
jgi:aspartyl-tRNA(Asn)/glutamyl-tRNA(Gln) amidotransferase subunit A